MNMTFYYFTLASFPGTPLKELEERWRQRNPNGNETATEELQDVNE